MKVLYTYHTDLLQSDTTYTKYGKRLKFCVNYTVASAYLFFHHGATAPPLGQDLLIFEDWQSYSDTPHWVGLLWTSDRPDAENLTWQHTNSHKRQTPIPPAGFEPVIPAQNHAMRWVDYVARMEEKFMWDSIRDPSEEIPLIRLRLIREENAKIKTEQKGW